MLQEIVINNFPADHSYKSDQYLDSFVMKTCQRTLILSSNPTLKLDSSITGIDAYQFMLEIICGLKSHVVAENEIVRQFKKAYQDYLQRKDKNGQIIRVLEKLFKDAKEIRTKHLLGVGQNSYAGLVRKILFKRGKVDEILILGSGDLAYDLILQFKKKTKVKISGRNSERVKFLSKKFNLEIVEWKDFDSYQNTKYIINTIGKVKSNLLSSSFFKLWASKNSERLFVDIGTQENIEIPIEHYINLNQIFTHGKLEDEKKREKIDLAKNAITKIAYKRSNPSLTHVAIA